MNNELDKRRPLGLQAEGAEFIDGLRERIIEAGMQMLKFNQTVDSTVPRDLPPDIGVRELEAMRKCAVSISEYLQHIIDQGIDAFTVPLNGSPSCDDEPFTIRIRPSDREFLIVTARTLREPTQAGFADGLLTHYILREERESIFPKGDETKLCLREALDGALRYLGGSRFNPPQLPKARSVCDTRYPGHILFPKMPF